MISDKCPKCGEQQMPKVKPGETATARACQKCGYVQTREEWEKCS